MLVNIKHGDDADVLGPRSDLGRLLNPLRRALDGGPALLYGRPRSTFYPGWLPEQVASRLHRLGTDLIHLHWIAGGFLNVGALPRLRLPTVWTLHDMWAFTGGCHYDAGCGRYRNRCGTCPTLGSRFDLDLSRWAWARKRRAYHRLPLTVVAPSKWLADEAKRSTLLSAARIEVVPNGLDVDRFRPIARALAREVLGLPADRQLILFGAVGATDDARKGFNYLQHALAVMSATWGEAQLTAVVFGASQPSVAPEFGMPTIYIGTLADDLTLALLYSAVDVFVAPSTQENLSNTVMEALACGTPCVAFDLGGMPDMIEHERNGWLARPLDACDLATGIRWVLEDRSRHQVLCARAREKTVQEFEFRTVARRYLSLYAELLAGDERPREL
jgi:glycosyltransferase involved in cell wall biosynthesis